MKCPKCGNEMAKNGKKDGKQKYLCSKCGCNRIEGTEARLPENYSAPKDEASAPVGLSEAALRQKHDTKFILTSAAAELKEGRYLTQSEFILQAGVRMGAGYRDVIEHPEFDKYKGRAGGQVYWSHPVSISKLKSEGVLR